MAITGGNRISDQITPNQGYENELVNEQQGYY